MTTNKANPPYPREPVLEPVMNRIPSPHSVEPNLHTSINKEPPYPQGPTMGAPRISKIDPPYPTSTNFLSSPPYPMPSPNMTEAENQDLMELIQGIKSALSIFDEKASHLFELTESTKNEAPKNVEFNTLYIPLNSYPITSKPSASYISEFSSTDSEAVMSKLSNIKVELSKGITKDKRMILKENLREVSQRIRLDASRMTPAEKKAITDEVLNIKSAYVNILKKNEPRRSSNHVLNSIPSQNETREASPFVNRDNILVQVEETNTFGINAPVAFKLVQMIFNTSYIFCIAKLSHQFRYLFNIYCEAISILGFCISLILLWIYLRKTRNDFSRKFLKFDIMYCIFMMISYIITTCIINRHSRFMWQDYFLSSMITGIFTMATYAFDTWHNVYYRLPGSK